MRRPLRDGALAGLAGGAALSLVLVLVGERTIARAIDLERGANPGAGPDAFSRGTQHLGGVVAGVLWGVALGALLGVAWAAGRRHQRPAAAPTWRAAVTMAAVAFVTVNLVPFLKYPGNPPGVGESATIGRRTVLYLLMLAWSVLSTAAAWQLARGLGARAWPDHLRLPAVVVAWVALVIVGLVGLPGAPDPVRAPATLVWRFRLASLAATAAFWAVAGTVFGWLRMAAAGEEPLAPLRRSSAGRGSPG